MDPMTWLDARWNEYLGDLKAWVKIPSVSRETNDPDAPFGLPCAHMLTEALALGERMGFEPCNLQGYCGTLLWKGQTEEEIGIFAHLDVVPEGTGWQYEPYEATLLEDKIVGRGTSDDKGPALAALYALRYLREQGYEPRHTFRYMFGVNEECGMKDIAYYVQHLPMPVFAFTPDAAFPVCHGEKGILEVDAAFDVSNGVLTEYQSGVASNSVPALASATLKLDGGTVRNALKGIPKIDIEDTAEGCKVTAHGIAAHAAFPEGSRSAQVALADALLRTRLLDEKTARFMRGVTSLFGDYYGAGIGIPLEDSASGKLTHAGGMARLKNGVINQNINIRYPVTADRERMMSDLTATLEAAGMEKIRLKDSKPCYIPKDTPIITTLTEISNRILGTDKQPYTMGGGTYARHLKSAVGFGPGLPGETESDFGVGRGRGHQPDEYATFHKLRNAFLIYAKAIPEMDRLV